MGIRFTRIKRVNKIKKISRIFTNRNKTRKTKLNVLIFGQWRLWWNLGVILKRYNKRKKTKIEIDWDSWKQ